MRCEVQPGGTKGDRAREARKTAAQGLRVCGKICTVASTVALAACSIAMSVVSCLLSCIGSDSVGQVGGGGFSFSMPT